MPTFVCQRQCYYRKQVFEPGMTVTIADAELKLPMHAMVAGEDQPENRKCFRRIDAPVAKKAVKEEPESVARQGLIEALRKAKVKGWSEAMTDAELRESLAKAGIEAP